MRVIDLHTHILPPSWPDMAAKAGTRGWPAIEHLAVTRDQFDVIDLTNNHLSRLENFPKLDRLNCLYLGGNGIDYVDGTNLKRNLPCLRTLILTGNGIRGWNVIGDLGSGCPKLEFLSLVGNPVTSKSSFCAFRGRGVCLRFREGCYLIRGARERKEDGSDIDLRMPIFRCHEPTKAFFPISALPLSLT